MNNDILSNLKKDFEANLLDGDAIQGGQMIASTEVWDWLSDALAALIKERELNLWYSLGNWNADKGYPDLFDLIDRNIAQLKQHNESHESELE